MIQSKVSYNEEMRAQTKKFALRIIKVFQELKGSDEGRIIGKQLLRSATGMAANYRASNRARSAAEFIAKMSIVVEEADETLFWLELISESGMLSGQRLQPLKEEALTLVKVFAKSRNTAIQNRKKNT